MFIGTRRRKRWRKDENVSGNLQPFDMDPGSVIPDLIRDRGDGRGAGTWTPDQVRDDGRGARTWTPGQARGDGLLTGPGFVRRLFRHSNPCACTSRGQGPLLQRGERLSPRERLVAAMPGFFRLHSVIPAKAEPAPDSIRGIHVHRDETAEDDPEISKPIDSFTRAGGKIWLRTPSPAPATLPATSRSDCPIRMPVAGSIPSFLHYELDTLLHFLYISIQTGMAR
jgi:hypothetical protein